LIASRVSPTLLSDALNSFPDGVIIVTGSSGKSTTTKMLTAILEAHGKSVFSNSSTANITQGIMSAILDEITYAGRLTADIAVLEMDEGHGAKLALRVHAHTVVLTNVMTDQIDRFSDPRALARMIGIIANTATSRVVTNADDATLEELSTGYDSTVLRYGVSESVIAAAPHGLGYLRTSATRLASGTIVEATEGATATIVENGESASIVLPARGVHYAVDAAAAISAAGAVLGDGFDLAQAASVLSSIPPVFGRGEVVTVHGRQVEFVLVQNPSSFQLNVDQIDAPLEQLLVAMGSDVRDPSYLWPVDTSALESVVAVTGSAAEEAALQLIYRGVTVGTVERDLGRALDDFLALPEPTKGVKTIIFSADAMRRTRAHWRL
jgi:UDP-N-acetylmuramyl tripeptide synthase